MFATLIQDTKRAAEDTVRLAYIGAFVGLLAAIALFFFIFAGYHWGAREFGPIEASFGLGIIFLVLAVAVYAFARMRRQSREQRETQSRDTLRQALGEQLSIDPRLLPSSEAISTSVAFVRKLASEKRLRQIVPAVVPAAALGVIVILAYAAASRARAGHG